MSLPRILHAEITRRAEGWRDYLVQASGDERHRRTGQAAGDIALWLRIANELGWSTIPPLPPIELRGDLAHSLRSVDQLAPLGDAADWQAARESITRSIARARATPDPAPPALIARLRDLRTIDRAFAHAEQAFAARTARAQPATPEPRKEAA